MAKRIRRRFTAEEQADAVRKVEESGRPISRVAAELGIDHRTVWQWVNNARLARIDPAGELSLEQRNRIRDLEKENALLRRDLDFAKKARALFQELDRENDSSK